MLTLTSKTWSDYGISLPAGAHGTEIATQCPKCQHERRRHPNARPLSCNTDKRCWICHHCGWAGYLDSGEQRMQPAWNRPRFRKPDPMPLSAMPDKAAQFFSERKITPDVLERNQIGWATVYMPQLEQESGAIVFPFHRDGELVNRKYRAQGKLFRMDTGAERILYGLDDVDTECVVIVEGEIDKLSVEVAGVTSCVSVPDGAPAVTTKDYSSKFTFLDSAKDKLDQVKRFILAVDSDEPGQVLEDELARRLGRERCYRVKWPEGCKDASDVLVQHSPEVLRWFLDNAEPLPIEGVFTALGEADNVFALYRNGLERGQKTGWTSLDSYYTVRPGEFTVVTGIPNSGKSNWLDALTVNLAKLHGWSFALFSPENQPIHDHMSRIAEKYVGLPFSDGPTRRMDVQDLELALRWTDEHFCWMLPNDETQWSIEWILARAKELVYRRGIRGLVIDPWNELESQRSERETETEYISRVLRIVRQFGRRHGVHVWMVVHPTKLYRDKDGQYPVPTLYDCHGAAHWRNKADNGICVWRNLSPEGGKEVDIHVQKVRFRQIGKLGMATLHYDSPTASYTDPEREFPMVEFAR